MRQRRRLPGGPPPPRRSQRPRRRWPQPRDAGPGRLVCGQVHGPSQPGRPAAHNPALRQDLFATATAVATAQPRAVANPYRPQVAPQEAGSGPIADQLSRTLTKAEETHQVTEDAIRRAALPRTGLGAMRPCADGHNDANRQSTVRLRLMLLGQAQGCGLTPLCNRWSEAYPPQWDRKEAAQRRCSDSQQEAVSRPHPYMGYVRLGCQLKPGDWRFCWSRADLWAWLDLNQRPHPYQVSRAKRCADRRFPRSLATVRREGMRSNSPLVCVHRSWR
jgi:hypothetical protein